MRRRKMHLSAALSAVAVIAASVLVTLAAYGDFTEAIKKEVIAETAYIRSGYEIAGDEYLKSLSHQQGHRITVISADGRVVYDSRGNAISMDNHSGRPEVIGALNGGTGESTRQSDTFSEQTYYYAVLLADGSVLRVSSAMSSIFSSFSGVIWLMALIAAAVVIASAVIASKITRIIVRPINALDLEQPENNAVYEEIVPLLKRIKEQRSQIDLQMLELDKGRREFEAITGNMTEGFLVLDKTGKVLSYNGSAAKLLETFAEDPSGLNVLALNREESFREAVQSALDGEAKERIIELHGRKCQLFANPVTESGLVQGMILLIMDVTEKQERESLRREFTANVSHELKTPLTSISGYAEIIANGLAKADDIPSFAGNIYKEAQRLVGLINDIMFLSGLEENVYPAKTQADLLAVSNEVVKRLEQKALEQEIALTVSGGSVLIQGYPSVLDEMIYNLADNAIKYNHKGGSVNIDIAKEGGTAILSVTDTGIGIPKAELSRIFERFYRVDKSHSKAIAGTGLGLSIVKHGAALHGAKAEAESSGEGSCFRLIFPSDIT